MLPDTQRLKRRLPRRAELLLLAAGAAAGLVLLLGLELAARAVAPGDEDGGDGIYDGHVYSERLGWEPRPGARFVVDGVPVSINPLGYRGRVVARQPPPGRVRVVVLGDSVAFGYGVADEQTFAHLIDPAGQRFEAVNLAVPGYGVDQSLLRYELSGRSWRPDVVVLNLCVDNDLADIMLEVFLYDGRHPKPRFSLRNGVLELHDRQLRLGRRARLGQWLRERSYLYRRLTRRPLAATGAGEPEHWTERRRRALEDGADAEDLMAALLGRLRRDVEQDGARLVLAIHPSRASYRTGPRWLRRLLRRPELQGLQVVPLGQTYRQARLGFGQVALDGIGHLSPRGHRLAADALRAGLERWPETPAAE